jgi:hypothetical protein
MVQATVGKKLQVTVRRHDVYQEATVGVGLVLIVTEINKDSGHH